MRDTQNAFTRKREGVWFESTGFSTISYTCSVIHKQRLPYSFSRVLENKDKCVSNPTILTQLLDVLQTNQECNSKQYIRKAPTTTIIGNSMVHFSINSTVRRWFNPIVSFCSQPTEYDRKISCTIISNECLSNVACNTATNWTGFPLNIFGEMN